MDSLCYFDFGTTHLALLLIIRVAAVSVFIIFDFPKMVGFGGTIQYMTSLSAPMLILAVAIVVVMEMPVVILVVLGSFTRSLTMLFISYTLGTMVTGHHHWDMIGDAVGPNTVNFWRNVSIAGAFLFLAITGSGAISLDRR